MTNYIGLIKKIIKKYISPAYNLEIVNIIGDVRIGRHSYYGRGCSFIAREGGFIEIGNFCSIAEFVTITNANHNYKTVTTFPLSLMLKTKDISKIKRDRVVDNVIIGSDVWIGTKTIILKGVEIGHGAVIGAGSVVTKSIPPFAIASGVPAKVVKYRFEEDQIMALLTINWWDWPEEKILKKIDLFYLPIDGFIRNCLKVDKSN